MIEVFKDPQTEAADKKDREAQEEKARLHREKEIDRRAEFLKMAIQYCSLKGNTSETEIFAVAKRFEEFAKQ